MTERPASLLSRLSRAEPAPPWSLATAIVAVVASFAIVVAVSLAVLNSFGDRPGTTLLAFTLSSLAIIAFVLQTRRQPRDREALRLAAAGVSLPLVFAVNLGLAVVVDFLGLLITGQALPVPELAPLRAATPDVFALVVGALFAVITQPIAEELVFRGITYPAFRVAFGAWPGIIGCALVYGVFHLAAYSQGIPASGTPANADASLWYGLLAPALSGLVFTLTRSATGSIRAAIVAHAAFGLFAIVKALALPG